MLHIIRWLGLLLLLTLFVTPARAGEAKISGTVIYYFAAPGETNDVTITFSDLSYYVRDTTALVIPGPGCTLVDLATARCPGKFITGLYASLLDGNDRLTNSTATGINAQGGTGRDTLTGGSHDDTLLGGQHEDDLYGGPGNDILIGGMDDDYLDGGANNDYMAGEGGGDKLVGGDGDDIMDGGPGREDAYGWQRWDDWDDVLTYEPVASGPVSVRLYLTTQQDTVSAGKDTISNVEILYGTVFGDTLAGKDGLVFGYELHGGRGDDKLYSYGTPNTSSYPQGRSYGEQGNDTFDVVQPTTGWFKLYGGPGLDTLRGGDGRDDMYGEDDKDYFDGRGGDDRISANDSLGEYVICGPGLSDQAWFDPLDALSGCELPHPP